VSRIQDINGRTLMFDRVIYRPAAGFPNENESVLNMTSAVGCCVACQTTVSCSGALLGFVVLMERLAQLRWVLLCA